MPAPDAAERLLNLFIALSHARVRMTRAEIRASVAGYDPGDDADDPATAKKRTIAFERMFERDKEDLRRLGVPLRTVTDATHGDEIGYVIDSGDAAMPPISLSAVERAILGVAADYWQNAALSTDARRALLKIASSATRVEEEQVPLAARSTSGVDAAPAIAQAIADGQALTFTYTSMSSGRAVRTVEPWRILVRGGRLYLVGFDRDRGEPRTYRLSRIEGEVSPAGERGAFLPPEGVAGMYLEATVPTLTARIALRAESGHAIRRRGRYVGTEGEWDLYDVPYCDTEFIRDEVLTLAGAARIVSPEDLAEAVVSHARAALEVADG